MTREQFIKRIVDDCLPELFRGYHTKETDSAMLYRMETAGAQAITAKAARLYDELFTKPPAPPQAVNGKPKETQHGTPTRT